MIHATIHPKKTRRAALFPGEGAVGDSLEGIE